jgi:hypothetical protein
MYYEVPKRTRRRYQVNAMKEIRLPQEPLWQEICDLVLPYRLRLNATDSNQSRRPSKIYNSTASRALKTLQSGLMTAATDPTSQWIRFTTKDPERAEYGPHRRWLDDACNYVLETIGDSNAYQNLPVGYGNSAGFGLFAMGMEEGFGRSALNTRLYMHGRFWIAKDDEGIVNTFYEECRATVRQLYMRFGEDANFSPQVKQMANRGEWEKWVDVGHMIEPNDEYEEGSPVGKRKRFSDCWWEIGNASGNKEYLGNDYADYIVESGRDAFPVLVGQWSSCEGDVYPTEYPGSECLGDNKSLQIGEKRMWQAIEKLVNPHWIAPAGLKGDLDDGFVPGKTSYVDEKNEGKSIRPAHIIDPNFIAPMREEILAVQQRILEAFHYPTFSTFDSLPDKQRTATEILERKSEKLLKLVDMYQNLQIGVLRPMVDYVFQLLIKRGDMFRVVGTPPPDLQGHQIEYRFQGVLAQAQKMNRVQPIQFALGVVGQIAEAQRVTGVAPEVLDKFNTDQAVDEISTDVGVPSTVIRSDAQVAAIREQRAQAQQQAQQMAALKQASEAAKNLGQAPLDDDNALGALVGA